MGRAGSPDLPHGESEIFFRRRLDSFLVICPSGNDPGHTQGVGHNPRGGCQVTQRPGCSNFATSVKTLTTGSQATVLR